MAADKPTRRGFLAACSAAAAALGLTAKAGPARPPIAAVPDGDIFDGPAHSHYLGPAGRPALVSAGERLFAGDACYIGPDGRLYRSIITRDDWRFTKIRLIVALHNASPGAVVKVWNPTS